MSDQGKTEWPELVGQTGVRAKSIIEHETQGRIRRVLTVKVNSMVTMDYRPDRVRIFVDSKGLVAKVPKIG